MKFKIKVLANSKQQKVKKQEGSLRVHLTSQPIKGEANRELVGLLAKHFKIKKSLIKVIKGQTSNKKEVEIK